MEYDNPQFTDAVKKIASVPLAAIADALHAIADGLQKQNASIKEATNSYKQSQYSPTLRTELHVPQSERYKKETTDTRKSIVEFWKVYIEVLGIAVVVAYTTVAAFQWWEMRKATKVAQGSLVMSEQNARLEQRAWVTISDMFPISKSITPWTINVLFENTGRTPAKNFAIKMAGEPVSKGRKPTAKEQTKPGQGIIAPDGSFQSRLSTSRVYDWNTLDLIVHGEITYDSVFGHSHWTKFCYYFVPENKTSAKGNFAPCDSGNEMDSNEP